MEEIKLKVPWGVVAAKAWGSSKDFPVLCVHGLLDNAGAFDRLIALLPKNYYYVSVDLPGHGLSSPFPPGLVIEFYNYVLCLRFVVEELKWQKFHYMGHSLGGQLGTFYSLLYPDRIQKFVSIEGIFPRVTPNELLLPNIRKMHKAAADSLLDANSKLYSFDEIMYLLRFMRKNCLNTEAAEALLERATERVGDRYKFNRDVRLKSYVNPLLTLDQIASIVSRVKVKTLLFFTPSTIELYNSLGATQLTTYLETCDNFRVIYKEGNHDIHNNCPELLACDIVRFFNDDSNVKSKL